MDGEVEKLVGVKDKFMDDFWSVQLGDAKLVADTLINAHYKNFDACEFERIGDDRKHWCLDNADKCKGFSTIIDNLWENGPALFSKAADLYDLMNTNDVCYSDSEVITEVERATEDVVSMISTIFGFDLKWDQTRQVTHIKRKDFRKQMAAKHIAWGEYFTLPDVDDIWNAFINMELPPIAQMIQFVEEALQYIGLE